MDDNEWRHQELLSWVARLDEKISLQALRMDKIEEALARLDEHWSYRDPSLDEDGS